MSIKPKGFIARVKFSVPGFRPPLRKLEIELKSYIDGIAAGVEEDQAQMIRHELEQFRLRNKILSDRERSIRYQEELARLQA